MNIAMVIACTQSKVRSVVLKYGDRVCYDTLIEVWYKCVERIDTIEHFTHARHFVHVPLRDVVVEGARVKKVIACSSLPTRPTPRYHC